MFPTLAVFSKASRRALTPKRGNKDYYKGTRQAQLPGGHRTGPPGRHVVRGTSKYRLIDEQIRVFVAPPIDELNYSPARHAHPRDRAAIFGEIRGRVTSEHVLELSRRLAAEDLAASEQDGSQSLEKAS